MAHRIEVSLEHEDARDESKLCDAEFSLDLQYEEGDAAYGADADGNRGINVPGYFEWCGEIPDKCSECGHVYTEDEKAGTAQPGNTEGRRVRTTGTGL
jgi:hypothetical protein